MLIVGSCEFCLVDERLKSRGYFLCFGFFFLKAGQVVTIETSHQAVAKDILGLSMH